MTDDIGIIILSFICIMALSWLWGYYTDEL